jgi:hypothetical protein
MDVSLNAWGVLRPGSAGSCLSLLESLLAVLDAVAPAGPSEIGVGHTNSATRILMD